VVVGSETYAMRPTPLMTNRFEGEVPISRERNVIQYRYKVDYDCNGFGNAKSNSVLSPQYTLKITEP
jgi:hypothetical protein